MARGMVTCTCKKCGKSFNKVKYCANRRDAESWESWASSNITICDDCRTAEINGKLVEKRKGLAALAGSEKQIAWAEKIRGEFVSGISDAMSSTSEEYIPLLNKVIDYIKSIPSASWWIDHRNFGDAANLAILVLSENPDKF